MSGGRVVALVVGALLALMGVGLFAGGGSMLAAGAFGGDDGYITTPEAALQTDSRALVSEVLHLDAPAPGDWVPWDADVDVRILVEPVGDAGVFVGVAGSDDVAGYLAGVAHAEVTAIGPRAGDVRYAPVPGELAPAPPGDLDIWVAAAEGTGAQELRWRPEAGSWSVVIMDPEGEPGVAVRASAGTEAGVLTAIGAVLLVIGLLVLAGAVALVIMATARPRDESAGTPAAGAGAWGDVPKDTGASLLRSDPGRTYPLRLTGRLDEPLSRGLWLVKWLLVVPHIVVLAFLWIAFLVLTVVAGVAILVTGRYPRGIFDVNEGILRWTWRVAYYSYGALGTDRYPPFALQAADYPADLQVAYPERLSRGLVLVKWWLLALPHYLIVGLFAGGAGWTATRATGESWTVGGSGGLIGLLVLIAGIVLLVRSRYPRGLFDLVMGLNRWVYRVIAYAALMTDEYPPFRLDMGGEDPPPLPVPPERAPSGGTASEPQLTG